MIDDSRVEASSHAYLNKVQVPSVQKASAQEISDHVNLLQRPLEGEELIQVIFESAFLAEQQANEMQDNLISKGEDSPHNKDILQLHKSALRLSSLAQNLSDNITAFSPTTNSTEILNNSKIFGLKRSDIVTLVSVMKDKIAIENVLEKQYRVLRVDIFRRHVVQNYLNQDIMGTMVEDDLIGLHGWNTYGTKYGDEALKRKAQYWHSILNHMGFNENTEFLIGRKGDEFFVFFAGKEPEEVLNSIHTYNQTNQEKVAKLLRVNIDDRGKQITKNAVSYWRMTEVNKDNVDQKLNSLESSIEQAKLETVESVLGKLGENANDPVDKLGLLKRYLIDEKRIPEIIVDSVIDANLEIIKAYASTDEDGHTLIDTIKALVADPKYRWQIRSLIETIALEEDPGENRIV